MLDDGPGRDTAPPYPALRYAISYIACQPQTLYVRYDQENEDLSSLLQRIKEGNCNVVKSDSWFIYFYSVRCIGGL